MVERFTVVQRPSTKKPATPVSLLVPTERLELPRFYPSVPETDASTNSATWATCPAPKAGGGARIIDMKGVADKGFPAALERAARVLTTAPLRYCGRVLTPLVKKSVCAPKSSSSRSRLPRLHSTMKSRLLENGLNDQ